MCKKMCFLLFSAEKPYIFDQNTDIIVWTRIRCMDNYDEIKGPSLTFSKKRAMI